MIVHYTALVPITMLDYALLCHIFCDAILAYWHMLERYYMIILCHTTLNDTTPCSGRLYYGYAVAYDWTWNHWPC